MTKVEGVIFGAEAMRTEDNGPLVDRMVNELKLVLEEFIALNPLQTTDPEIFVGMALRMQQALVKFLLGISFEALNRIGRGGGRFDRIAARYSSQSPVND